MNGLKRKIVLPLPVRLGRGPVAAMSLVMLLAMALATGVKAGWFRFQKLVVTGNQLVSYQEIEQLARVPAGINLFAIDRKAVANRVAKDLKIARVTVSYRLPGTLLIEVSEKQYELLLNLKDLYGLSNNLEIFPLPRRDSPKDLPIVTGIELLPQKFYSPERDVRLGLVKNLYKAIQAVDPGLLNYISEIFVSRDKQVELYLVNGGARILCGTGDFEWKFSYLKQLLIQTPERLPESRYDLRFPENLFVGFKNADSTFFTINCTPLNRSNFLDRYSLSMATAKEGANGWH